MPFNSAFKDSLDIANRACDACGVSRIRSVTEVSRQNQIIPPLYDKMRQFELRRNVWRFAKRKTYMRPIDATTLRLVPQTYDASALYLPGSIVGDANGDMWISFVTENVGNAPGASDVWEPYFGQLAVPEWDATVAGGYNSGELVYKATSLAGSFVVYQSAENANSDTPDTVTVYDATVAYVTDEVVASSGYQWRSVIPFNLNNTPVVAPNDWVAGTTYAATNTATGSDGYIYTSVGSSNTGNDPVLDDGTLWTKGGPYAWSRIPILQPSSNKWVPIYAGLQPLGLEWQMAASDSGDSVYLMPQGYLREATLDPNNPKRRTDRLQYGEYMTTSESPLSLAYVADITKVSRMDTMFCEMLALRIAEEACEPLTQSRDKISTIMTKYTRFGFETRQVNAIEEGSEEPEEDWYLAVRWT